MKKEDSLKTKEAIIAQKELNTYTQRKIQLIELENQALLEQAKKEIIKDVLLRKEEIIKIIEEKTRLNDLKISEERERKIRIFNKILDKIKILFFRKIHITKEDFKKIYLKSIDKFRDRK